MSHAVGFNAFMALVTLGMAVFGLRNAWQQFRSRSRLPGELLFNLFMGSLMLFCSAFLVLLLFK